MQERILVVDDDESLLEVCEVALRRAGYKVKTAPKGEDALKILESENFDLILTDLHMPGAVDGSGVVRWVKARRPGAEVIVFTAMPALKTAIDTLKDGASDYVIKPFSTEHLKAAIRRCLDHRRIREELSSERSLRKELEAAYKELQKVERLKEAFLSRVSHELRTPLSGLLTGLRLLEEELGTAAPAASCDKPDLLSMTLKGAERLEKTIYDLLAFVEMQSGKELSASRSVDIEALCRKAAERLKPLWEPRRLTVEIAFAPEARRIQGDCDRLQTAFEHLLHNAVVFNKEGGRVRVEGRRLESSVEISVADTGDGIPESEFPKIFDGFYQIADYLTRKVEGLGLGLATTRRIVEAHGGDIRVSSRPGKGTTFTVALPLKGPSEAPGPRRQTPTSPKIPSGS